MDWPTPTRRRCIRRRTPKIPRAIQGLFGTAYDASGNQVLNGRDIHYSLISTPPFTPPFVGIGTLPQDAPVLDQFRNLGFTNCPVGIYVFRMSFDLTGYNTATASITLDLSCDDQTLDILLNGISTGGPLLWPYPKRRVIASNFVPGVNIMDFNVYNMNFAMRLQVTIITSTATPL
jgi:hypothetical protein